MRTTLTLDDALEKELKKLAAETGRSFKETVNSVIAQGLVAKQRGPRVEPYRIEPVSLGGVRAGVNLDKALALASSLEDEERARKLELRK